LLISLPETPSRAPGFIVHPWPVSYSRYLRKRMPKDRFRMGLQLEKNVFLVSWSAAQRAKRNQEEAKKRPRRDQHESKRRQNDAKGTPNCKSGHLARQPITEVVLKINSLSSTLCLTKGASKGTVLDNRVSVVMNQKSSCYAANVFRDQARGE